MIKMILFYFLMGMIIAVLGMYVVWFGIQSKTIVSCVVVYCIGALLMAGGLFIITFGADTLNVLQIIAMVLLQ